MDFFKVQKRFNNHLCDRTISLDAKGLLAQMMSLPDDHSFTLEELTQLNTDKPYAICKALEELECAGYIICSRCSE